MTKHYLLQSNVQKLVKCKRENHKNVLNGMRSTSEPRRSNIFEITASVLKPDVLSTIFQV